jgi:DNA-directed RNA polymerase subunit RPC12/RpoP
MKGKCPSCARIYEISDEFLSMGGSAKCPHCMEDLDFGAAAQQRDPRTDQTRIDPRREAAATRVEPEEVDARCAGCKRRFRIDAEYLRLGGEARCPHCDLELVFDVPQPAPPPKPPEEALWDDTTGQTVEVGAHRGVQPAAEDEPEAYAAEDEPEAYAAEDEPEAYAAEDEPEAYAAEDEPEAYAAEDEPEAYAAEDEPDR